jgi:hypothetical protein
MVMASNLWSEQFKLMKLFEDNVDNFASVVLSPCYTIIPNLSLMEEKIMRKSRIEYIYGDGQKIGENSKNKF